jgi:hypothetical protein
MDHGSVAAAEEAAHSKIVDSQSPSVWKSTPWFEVTHNVDRENERRRPLSRKGRRDGISVHEAIQPCAQ